MNVYLTHGSDYYMNRLIDKHPDRSILKFAGPDDIVLYEATELKTVFSSGEAYEVIEQNGEVTDKGPIMMRYFQVSEEKVKVAENALADHGDFNQYEGYQSYQLLRPLRGQTYISLFQFSDPESLEDFKKSSVYRERYDETLKQYQSADFVSNIQFTKILHPYSSLEA
ncbi:hypothetical protein ERX37_00370 [Macrococcus hajekii]|uniref:Signal transduction protein TRAP n=1 Tax=Macrococcus hajekii TaxID=198482 RepID=A0A4V3BE39_9STAP|nr:antibiotic biosynthesis monooxygenase [Macrococcus hajekii]TDM02585.1 hypothetical protein ERX37_00370 [Macrococcus hajekii]GGB02156.1 heme-degrading monooxygenase HmoB [Macrococcus hajekii]